MFINIVVFIPVVNKMASEYYYGGAKYPLQPETEVSGGYQVSAADVGITTDWRQANQLQEFSKKLNIGTKTIEISMVKPEIFEAIPVQQLREINRLSKLTGADMTLHAPIVEPSGFGEDRWSEVAREMAEKSMTLAVTRARDLNPNKGIVVTFHSSAILPEGVMMMKEKEGIVPKAMSLVDPQTGKIVSIKEQERFFPEEEGYFPGKPRKFDPKKELEKINKDSWLETLNQLTFYANRGRDLMDVGMHSFKGSESELEPEKKEEAEKTALQMWKLGKELKPEQLEKWEGLDKAMLQKASREFEQSQVFLMDSYNHLKNLYDRVYKEANPKDREKLDAYANKIAPLIKQGINKEPEQLGKFASMVEEGIRVLKDVKPEIYRPLNDFVLEKSGQTFANVAWNALQAAQGDVKKTPIISIENPPVGAAFSRAEDLTLLIDAARKKFVEKAKSEGMSESKAEDTAKKIIGATWDVGHINMLRKYGYGAKELEEQTEKIAKYVKHVHLSDNFGLEHTELPMGMGTVPIQAMLAQLEKEGVSPKKIIEAGNWYEHFKTLPFKQTLEAMGSPVYAMKAQPYWSQSTQMYGGAGYSTGYGTIFPEEHVSMYGTGFSALPAELGGQVQQRGSRFAGAPME